MSAAEISLPSLKNPALNGGPQFGGTRYAHSSYNTVRLSLIALAVLALSILWIRNARPSDLLAGLSIRSHAIKNTVSQSTATHTQTPGVTLELNNDGITAQIPTDQINIITEQAERGDGTTRLARQAITERLQDESLALSSPQRIYAEDFVQKKMDANILRTGQKLSFPTELLDRAIQRAQTLTPQEIQNLSRYAAHVNFQ